MLQRLDLYGKNIDTDIENLNLVTLGAVQSIANQRPARRA
jgi:hypothetical protein